MSKVVVKTGVGGRYPAINGVAILAVVVGERFLNKIPGPGDKKYLDSSDFERIVSEAVASRAKSFISEEEMESMEPLPLNQNKTFTEDFIYSGNSGTIRFRVVVSSSVAEVLAIRFKMTVEGGLE